MPQHRYTIRQIANAVRRYMDDRCRSQYRRDCCDHGGECQDAAWTIHRLLLLDGHDSRFVWGFYVYRDGIMEGHCWVEVDDKIVDVTATQFDINKPVFIVKRGSPRYSGRGSILTNKLGENICYITVAREFIADLRDSLEL